MDGGWSRVWGQRHAYGAMCDQSHWENDDVWSDPTPWQKNPWSLEKPGQQRGEDHWKMKPFRLIIRARAGKCIDRSPRSAFHTSPHGSDFIKWSQGFRWRWHQNMKHTGRGMKEQDHWPSCRLRKAEAALIRIFIPYKSYLVSQAKQMKQIAS